MVKKTNILFICKFNRFRSRLAKTYFDKVNKDKNYKTKSAGLIKGSLIGGKGVKIAKNKYGLNIKGKAQLLSVPLLLWQDIIVIMANNVPSSIFNEEKKQGKRIIVFKIKDVNYKKKITDEDTIKDVIKQVNSLIKLLNKKK